MKKLFGLFAVVVLVSSLLVGCGTDDSDTIKIGVNLELTGPVSIYGIPERKAMELALEEINTAGGVLGKQLEFVFYDNEYDNAKAVENAIKFATEDNVVAMLGPATSSPSLAVGAIAKEYEMVNFTPSATALDVTMDGDKVNPWVFRASFIDPFQGLVLANFATTELESKNAVIMYSDSSDYSNGLAEAFEEKYTGNGGTVVKKATYTDQDSDFSAQLTSLSNLEFDVIFVADYAERGGLIVNQLRAMGIDVPVLGPDGFDTPDFNDLAGGADNVNDVFFVNHFSVLLEDPQVVSFIAAHEAKYDEKPNALSALAYDAVYMLVEAIKAADSTKPADIRDALDNLGTFDGVTGDILMNEFNNPVKSAVVIELKNGEQVKATVVQP
jgi:branched-chain amino acid transport system substrate-binding protein